jgi:MEDS: MEthanogen/methylotroph, DcmR Sensory domain
MSAYATTGLQSLGELPWGSHVCQFFSNGSDLSDTLVPYFKAGLENNERCLLVAMEPFTADNARSALRAAVGDFDRRERRKQIEIHDVRAWYNSDTIVKRRRNRRWAFGQRRAGASRWLQWLSDPRKYRLARPQSMGRLPGLRGWCHARSPRPTHDFDVQLLSG